VSVPLTRILITGASSEIGAALSRALGARCPLVLGGRDAARLEEVRASCPQPQTHALWRLDLEAPDNIAASLEREVLPGGAISHFVHVAGMARPGTLSGFAPRAVSRMFAVNVLSALEIVRALAQKRLNGEHLASVLAVSSISVGHGARGFAVYAASKSALEIFVRDVAAELGRPIEAGTLRLPEIRVERSSGAGTAQLQEAASARERWPGPGDAAQALQRLLEGAEGPLGGAVFTLRASENSFTLSRSIA
jgi:NAD(P)-dependent dehydrogenase (short-subunit alcohol dehydrogenase family)